MSALSVPRRGLPAPAITGRLPVYLNGETEIPSWVVDHDSFRRWARSDDFPEQGRFAYLNGILWADLTMEQLFTHGAVKSCIGAVLHQIVQADSLGYLYINSALISHSDAGLSSKPDTCFISFEAIEQQRARLIEGAGEGYVEVEGSPDMTLEIVSASSVQKDTIVLRDLYWKAGVTEYWLVDARQTPVRFSILKRQAKGYVETRKAAEGWLKSTVFGRSFRLVATTDRLGHPQFQLEVRD